MSANNDKKIQNMWNAIKDGVNNVGTFFGSMGNTVKEWWNSDTYDANEGGGTPVTPTPTTDSPVMNFGEYEGLINTAKAQRENTKQMWDDFAKNEIARANAAHSASYAEADRLRAQAERDAWLSFEKSAPTYGAQGESLARSGLAGSGYSAYLEGRNYATARNEVSAAGATAAKSKAAADMTYADAEADINEKVIEGKAAADTTYNEFENGIQAQIIADNKEKDEQFQIVLKEIEDGTATYTEDQIKAMGFGEVQTNALISKATEKNTAAELTASVTALSDEFAELGENFDVGKVDELLAQEGLSDTDKQTLEGIKKTYVDNIVNDAKTVFAGGNAEDIAETLYNADQLCAQGKISKDVWHSIYFDYALTQAEKITDLSAFESFLKGLVDKGKLTKVHYNKAMIQAKANTDIIVPMRSQETSGMIELGGQRFHWSYKGIDDKKIGDMEISAKEIKNELKSRAPGAKLWDIACLHGELYVKTPTGWNQVKVDKEDEKDFYNALELYNTNRHQNNIESFNAWTNYEEAAKAGYSNIMTPLEWARRKGASGGTYEEYLKEMYFKYHG